MPNAHVTVQPTGQAIATTSGHSLARRSRPRKTSPHCSSPTATPVARPVISSAPIAVPAPVSNAPRASPIATPKAVAKIHSGPTLMYLRSTNHWAAPITAPAKAPPSAPATILREAHLKLKRVALRPANGLSYGIGDEE